MRVSNSFDSDQNQCFVGLDLDPNCLQRLSSVTKVAATSKKEIVSHLV